MIFTATVQAYGLSSV